MTDKLSSPFKATLSPDLSINPTTVKPKRQYKYTKKTGRPAKTTKDLPPNWKDIILKGAMEGKTDEEIRKDIVTARGTTSESVMNLFYRLQDRDIEFRQAINSARYLQKAWWDSQGRKALKRRYFQGNTWYAIMKNCFGYREKTETDIGLKDETWEKFGTYSPEAIAAALDTFQKRGDGSSTASKPS